MRLATTCGKVLRRLSFLLVPLLISTAASVSTAAGQVPESLAGYTKRRWTAQDGLPQNAIRHLLQTRDGYLWIATSNGGVARFDGVSFTTFDMTNTPGFPSNWISTIHEAADGAVWIGTSDGLARYQGGAFTFHRLGPDATHNLIRTIQEGPNGQLWVASVGQVVRRNGDAWTPISLGNPGINTLLLDRTGTLWIGTATGLIEWNEGIRQTWTSKDGLPEAGIEDLFEDSQQRLWVMTRGGLVTIDRQKRIVQREAPFPVLSIAEDRSGTLWIGGLGKLFERSPDGHITPHDLWNPSAGSIRAMLLDREGHLWLGVDGGEGGLVRLRKHTVRVLTQVDGLPCDDIGPVLSAPDGTIWVGTLCQNGGLSAIVNGRVQYTVSQDAGIFSLLVDRAGQLWAANHHGHLFRLEGRRLVQQPGPIGESTGGLATMYADTDGAIWVGGDRGLFKLQNGTWTSYHPDDGLLSDQIRTIVSDNSGGLWIGTMRGVSRYHNGGFTNITAANGLPRGPVRAIYPDADGAIWIGTYGGGLSRFKNGRIFAYGTQGGTLDSSVHRIVDDGEGNLWFSGDRGIRRVSRRELNAIADRTASTLTAVLFDESDGMKTAECNGGGQPAGSRSRDGVIWFPTQRGVVLIDPKQAGSPAMAVTPIVEQTLVDGASRPGTAVTLDPDARDIELRFTAPAFLHPEHVQFRYRLDGYDADWLDGGSRRVAHYANLRPGTYTFQLAARTAGSEWSTVAAPVVLILQPRWYQRRSVQLGLGFLLIALSAGAVRWRVTRLQRRARELETVVGERTAEVERQRDEVRAAHDRLAAATSGIEQAHSQVLGVLNQLEIGALVLEPNGTIRYATDPARRLLENGIPIVGRSWTECLPLTDGERTQIMDRFEAPPPSRTRLPVQLTIHGRRYWMALDVRDEPPPGTGRILYLSDVTEIFGLRTRNEGKETFHDMVGRGTGMQLVFKQIRDVAGTDVTVLIDGETGSGKELVARAIHRAGRRAEKPFVAVNTAGLTESLIVSQLFGHRRGSFTGAVSDQIGLFESASGGTLFLDEIGDIPMGVQTSLLRVLQEREITRLGETAARKIDVRFVAATHRDLAREVADGRMRQDLLYRIRVATIRVPALRDRVDDMPLLVEKFLADSTVMTGKDVRGLAREAMDALLVYPWPGNVRELKSAIEQAVLRSAGPVLKLDDLPLEIARGAAAASAVPVDAGDRARLIDALRRANGNRTEAARLLGIGRATLYRKMALYGLSEAKM